MDFGLVDTLVSSATSASNNGGTSFSDPDNDVSNKQRGLYGFGFMKQERAANGNDEDFRDLSKISRMRSGSADAGHQQMLCFSSPSPVSQPYNYHQASYGFGSNSGGLRGPFTPSQWMELEHQALIYKYITANVPIPSYLLHPIRKAFESVGFSTFAGLRSNALGWGAFHLGFSSTDPEPGRCRRTDGKKWRCSRDAVVDQKYCERHMNRGRHRSRKPVEGQSGPPATKTTTSTGGKPTTNAAVVVPSHHPSGIPNIKQSVAEKDNNAATSNPSFGLVCSDSLLNPLNRSSSLRQFMDEWPENELDKTQLSISISSDEKLEMGLGVGPAAKRTNHRQVEEGNWVPISWEPSMGGPLGEALHAGGECNSTKPLNLIGTWESNSPRLASSPTGVLQKGPFGSLSSSSAGSSPRAGLCNGLIGSSLMNPSLPSL